ncbi:MAG: DUF1080 domain-containing protein [Saprospiraceae bacterium]|jgi:hypothetical protein|nr:DUF1080 domain-containing protein [Saprospiraceae bacterium]
MKSYSIFFYLFTLLLLSIGQYSKEVILFDGLTFNGWEGDTLNTWRIEDNMIIGGSLIKNVPENNFLCTRRSYSNFILKFKIKLVGHDGFINAGLQFRSVRATNPSNEMIGYQADWGKDYWASLYDESRRNKTLASPDSAKVLTWIKQNDWNDYVILAKNNRIRLFINGHKSVDYLESDPSIPLSGLIGLQIHGGGKAEVYFKELYMKEL